MSVKFYSVNWKNSGWSRKFFTLIELLIVIAIIAILAAMLLPALNKARDSAKNIDCIARTKQLMLAMTSYTDDNGNFLPYISGNGAGEFSQLADSGGTTAEEPSPICSANILPPSRMRAARRRRQSGSVHGCHIPEQTG